MHQLLNSSQKPIFRAFQDLESKALMADLLDKPDKWHLSMARFSSSVIMSVVFGRRTALGDPDILAVHRAQEEFVPFTMPGASVVDSFPFLAKIPYLKMLQPWRRKGDEVNRRTTRYADQTVPTVPSSLSKAKLEFLGLVRLFGSSKILRAVSIKGSPSLVSQQNFSSPAPKKTSPQKKSHTLPGL
jgi:hypothetical protein